MESSRSVQPLTATFTVIECPRIHRRIRSRNVSEKAKFKRKKELPQQRGSEQTCYPVKTHCSMTTSTPC